MDAFHTQLTHKLEYETHRDWQDSKTLYELFNSFSIFPIRSEAETLQTQILLY